MKDLRVLTQTQNILNKILKFSQKKNLRLYIVGGFLRDMALARQRPNPDIDFAINKNAIKFAACLAKQLHAGFVVLDKENGCARLVKKIANTTYTLDFTDFRGKDLEQDLKKRDFTINSLAAELKSFLSVYKNFIKAFSAGKSSRSLFKLFAHTIIDPCQGMKDLNLKVVRLVSLKAYDDDPLRILRAFSLSCILGFKLKAPALELAEKKRNKLKNVSFERIREELFKILTSPNSYGVFVQLDKKGLLELIIPEIKVMYNLNQGPYHHLDVWQHSLETLKQLEKVIKYSLRNSQIRDFLYTQISSGRRRLELIKIAALLHDIGKPATLRIEKKKISFHGHEHVGTYMSADICRRLKLSNSEISALKKMILYHLRPGYLADQTVITRRAKFRFFRDAADEAISVLLICLADLRSTRGDLITKRSLLHHQRVVRRLMKEYYKKKKEIKPVRLINGDDLIRHFKLQPSPLIGQILSEIEEVRAIGKIKHKKQALSLAREFIKTKSPS